VALLDIRVLGDPILRAVTKPVQDVTAELRQLVDDMFETMHAAQGVGLAAPQVGRSERLTVIDVGDGKPFALFNAEIVHAEGTQKGEEGCLSIPEVYGDVERAIRVVARGLDRDGTPVEIDGTELLARCLQHEIDHLDGKLFLDRLSVLKRRAAMAKWALERGKYPNFIRKLTPEEVARHHHRDEEL
jgi:peptide deformylase